MYVSKTETTRHAGITSSFKDCTVNLATAVGLIRYSLLITIIKKAKSIIIQNHCTFFYQIKKYNFFSVINCLKKSDRLIFLMYYREGLTVNSKHLIKY